METKTSGFGFKDLEPGQAFMTDETPFSERNLILGILWEGDLQIHSDSEAMITHPFGAKIVHGSSVASVALGLLFKMYPIAGTRIGLKEIHCSYVKPVYVEDNIKAYFKVTSREEISDNTVHLAFNFDIFKNDKDLVCKGDIVISITLNR